jgi:hypothetical protein
MNNLNFRDVEQLSAYLDGKLSQADVARLETKLQNDPALASTLEALRQTRTVLRRLPQRRVPRNFTLSRAQAGVKAPTPRYAPFFQWASALAMLFLFFSFATNSVAPALSVRQMSEPMPMGMGGGGAGGPDLASEEAGLAMSAPAAEDDTLRIESAPDAAPKLEQDALIPLCTSTPADWIMHTVQPGETLIGLAQTYGTTVRELQLANCLYSETIFIDQTLYVPREPTFSLIEQPIPNAALIGLFLAAIFAAAITIYLNWDAERRFKAKNK